MKKSGSRDRILGGRRDELKATSRPAVGFAVSLFTVHEKKSSILLLLLLLLFSF